MDRSFAKRIRFNSYIYRNRDRLMESNQHDDVSSSGSNNVIRDDQNINDHHIDNVGPPENVSNESTENDYSDASDDGDNDGDDAVNDYLME
uniref:Uncharacterized protein n=1 Tax=Anopheles funestus TaxID=62324 RepID=A0A182S4H6_ANOFN